MISTSSVPISINKANAKCYILLPAFNEVKNLSALIPKIKEVFTNHNRPYQIIICDDGSNDGTRELINTQFSDMPISVIEHKRNRGLGETIRDLFEYVSELADVDDIIIRMDSDDTHDPIYMPSMIKKLLEGYDVVIASRFLEGGGQTGVSNYRAFVSYCANFFMKIVLPIRGIREYSCGFRAYRARILKQAINFYGNDFVQLKGMGFTCTLEKLIKLKILGASFAESAFELKYNRKLSESKMVGSITTIGYFVLMLCYHWPWGGWKKAYGKRLKISQALFRCTSEKFYLFEKH
jgi:dolichol-phosphate mannosyltransferase